MITFTGTPAGDAAPRLVDIHSHGAVGAQFGHGEEGSRAAAAHHRACGTSAIMASLVTATDDDLWAQVGVLAPLVADGTVLGIPYDEVRIGMRVRPVWLPESERSATFECITHWEPIDEPDVPAEELKGHM